MSNMSQALLSQDWRWSGELVSDATSPQQAELQNAAFPDRSKAFPVETLHPLWLPSSAGQAAGTAPQQDFMALSGHVPGFIPQQI